MIIINIEWSRRKLISQWDLRHFNYLGNTAPSLELRAGGLLMRARAIAPQVLLLVGVLCSSAIGDPARIEQATTAAL